MAIHRVVITTIGAVTTIIVEAMVSRVVTTTVAVMAIIAVVMDVHSKAVTTTIGAITTIAEAMIQTQSIVLRSELNTKKRISTPMSRYV